MLSPQEEQFAYWLGRRLEAETRDEVRIAEWMLKTWAPPSLVLLPPPKHKPFTD